MIVDIHTHIFPDALAPRAISSLQSACAAKNGEAGEAYTNATVSGLLESMKTFGIDRSVICPVVTAPRQTPSINRFAKSINDKPEYQGRILSFAGIFPGQEGWEAIVEQTKEDGFQGFKIHPEYQGVDIDSKECIALLKKCEELDLFVITHCGEDVGVDSPVVHSKPEQIANVLDCITGDHLICAHMGGWGAWDDVEKYLVGSPVYFDTAYVQNYLSKEQALRMIRNHGADKVLFGTDSPWERPDQTIAYLESLGLSDPELRAIYGSNAKRLLNI